MKPLELAAVLVVLAAAFRYLNDKLLKLPPAIGVMALALATSLVIGLTSLLVPGLEDGIGAAVGSVDLGQTFLHGMLGFILFAGALKTDLRHLAERKWQVIALATLGVLISTAVVGLLTWGLLNLLGIGVRPIFCFLFGALISPTDPVAVLAILRRAGVPGEIEVTMTGESLFNDGVGIVVFIGLLQFETAPEEAGALELVGLFLWESLGGAAFGLAAGWVVYRLLRSLDNYQVEILLTVALVAGGFTLADRLNLSGPIAMAAAGLLIGNYARAHAMSPTTLQNLDSFWELIDETLNAVLFVILGLEVLVLAFAGVHLLAGCLAIPLVLFARWVSVSSLMTLVRKGLPSRLTIQLLTWGGLRGGIAVALALSLPASIHGEPVPERQVVLALTYPVVVFSILVQGLTIGPLARRNLIQTEGVRFNSDRSVTPSREEAGASGREQSR